ncbi:MAG TPA: anti-sigma factor antagonist [Vicinamibacterales bacterium]|nr:anti-sigma factor antagonist [Vicinamibacterales bacterium]
MVFTGLNVRTLGEFVIIEPGAAIRLCEDELMPLVTGYVDRGYRKFVFNLRDVHYMDSASLGGIVQSFGIVTRRGGRFVLCSCVPRLIDLLETTKLHRVFEIFDAEDEAIRSFR